MLALKIVFVLGLALTVSAQVGVPGGITPLSGNDLKEAEATLQTSLSKLASGDGPNYQLGRVISATRQVVAGNKYVYDVELIDGNKTKQCKVELLSQPWVNNYEVTFDCPDGKVVKTHN